MKLWRFWLSDKVSTKWLFLCLSPGRESLGAESNLWIAASVRFATKLRFNSWLIKVLNYGLAMLENKKGVCTCSKGQLQVLRAETVMLYSRPTLLDVFSLESLRENLTNERSLVWGILGKSQLRCCLPMLLQSRRRPTWVGGWKAFKSKEKIYRLLLNCGGEKVSWDLLSGQVDNCPEAEDTDMWVQKLCRTGPICK